MAKRKEYLNESERMMLKWLTLYNKETGPCFYQTPAKRTFTMAFHATHKMVNDRIIELLNHKSNRCVTDNPDYIAAYNQVMKEIEEDVDNFWLRSRSL